MTPRDLIDAVLAGVTVSHAELAALNTGQRAEAVDGLLGTEAGRAWLRRDPQLDMATANRLIVFERDYQKARRDASLGRVVRVAALDAVVEHARAIASGPAAAALWQRLRNDGEALNEVALAIVASDDQDAAEATLVHLVLDPLNDLGLTEEQQGALAATALASPLAAIRGLAAEHMLAEQPAELLASFDVLIRDASEQVRGVVWAAALQLARDDACEIAIELLGDEAEAVEVRRSALIAIGTQLTTAVLVDVLSLLVTHPDERLATDAAELLYQQHRHPIVAEAARRSPHARVREVAEYLLDPYRGSPAAGGSRPGDPTQSTANIFGEMIRKIEERAEGLGDERGIEK